MTDRLPNVFQAEERVKHQAERRVPSVGLPKLNVPLLLTFELCERMVFWTAVRKRPRRGEQMFRGSVELGYDQIEDLVIWFEHFWRVAGDRKHEIHVQVSGPELQQRSFMIPVVPGAEISAVVRSEAKRVFPVEIDNGLFGWKVIGKVDWAGGMKYQIYSLLLGEHWNKWLSQLFGEHLRGVSVVTANALIYECNLSASSKKFAEEDSYLTRLKINVVETAFFHEGHLEFYREVPVESMTDGGAIGDLRKVVGMDSPDESADQEIVINELTTVMRDAIDYYQGQFGQRSIKTAYISLPAVLSDALTEFINTTIGASVIDLNSPDTVTEHCKKLRVAPDVEDGSKWMSIYPCRKIGSSIVNLVPKFLTHVRREARVFHYCIALSVAALLTASGLSLFKASGIITAERDLRELSALVDDVESSPTLQKLSEIEANTEVMQRNLSWMASAGNVQLQFPMLLLSHTARKNVRLNTVGVKSSGTSGTVLNLTGEVVGPSDRQEAELFSYMLSLRDNTLVESIKIGDKRIRSQLASQKTLFSMEIVTKKK